MAQLNQIGPFLFLDLAGGVVPLQPQVESEQRPGVDGTEFRTLGLVGSRFALRSRCDAFNVADAQNAMANYVSLVGAGLQSLVQYGTDYASFGVGVMVMAVRPISLRAMVYVAGGLFPPSQGWIEAEWSLMGVAL